MTWGFASANRSFIVSEFLSRTSVTRPNGQGNPATGRDQRGLRIELARLEEQDASLLGCVATPLRGVAASGSPRRVGRRGLKRERQTALLGAPRVARTGQGTGCSSELRAPHLAWEGNQLLFGASGTPPLGQGLHDSSDERTPHPPRLGDRPACRHGARWRNARISRLEARPHQRGATNGTLRWVERRVARDHGSRGSSECRETASSGQGTPRSSEYGAPHPTWNRNSSDERLPRDRRPTSSEARRRLTGRGLPPPRGAVGWRPG
jgi:hypothetical protein